MGRMVVSARPSIRQVAPQCPRHRIQPPVPSIIRKYTFQFLMAVRSTGYPSVVAADPAAATTAP